MLGDINTFLGTKEKKGGHETMAMMGEDRIWTGRRKAEGAEESIQMLVIDVVVVVVVGPDQTGFLLRRDVFFVARVSPPPP